MASSGSDLRRRLIGSNPVRNDDFARYPWAFRLGHFVPGRSRAARAAQAMASATRPTSGSSFFGSERRVSSRREVPV